MVTGHHHLLGGIENIPDSLFEKSREGKFRWRSSEEYCSGTVVRTLYC